VRWDRDAGRWFAFVLVACAVVSLAPAGRGGDTKATQGTGWLRPKVATLTGARPASSNRTLATSSRASPDSSSPEPGRHDRQSRWVTTPRWRCCRTVGWSAAGGEGRMLVWEATTRRQITQLACSAIRLAAAEASRGETSLVVAHAGQGFSVWSTTKPGSTEALAN
jgi:hypothetical protein